MVGKGRYRSVPALPSRISHVHVPEPSPGLAWGGGVCAHLEMSNSVVATETQPVPSNHLRSCGEPAGRLAGLVSRHALEPRVRQVVGASTGDEWSVTVSLELNF